MNDMYSKQFAYGGYPYDGLTYTRFEDGQYYAGWQIPIDYLYLDLALYTDAAYVDPFVQSQCDDSEGCETWSDKCSEASSDNSSHSGMLVNYLGWKDASKNYGFIETKEAVMDQTRFIVFDIPSDCKQYDTVEFLVSPNKKGKDKWMAVYLDKH